MIQEQPLVSVVTVCRNALPLLKLTMGNVAEQQYDALEYIVVDGQSDDGTVAFLQSYGNRLTRWTSEPDGGIYDAMNKGASMATGQWVVFMNAGDRFAATDVLARVFSVNRSEADVIYGDVVRGGQCKKAEAPHNSHRMYFCHQSALVRRTCLQEFPFDTSHTMSADFKQMKQLYKAGKRFVQLPFAVADFDLTGVSNTRRSSGLMDNMKVVCEVDSWPQRLRLLPRLAFTWLWCKLRGR